MKVADYLKRFGFQPDKYSPHEEVLPLTLSVYVLNLFELIYTVSKICLFGALLYKPELTMKKSNIGKSFRVPFFIHV